jgi:hypothetical protein
MIIYHIKNLISILENVQAYVPWNMVVIIIIIENKFLKIICWHALHLEKRAIID